MHKRRSTLTQYELDWFSLRTYGKTSRSGNESTFSNGWPAEKVVSGQNDPMESSLTRLPFQVFLATDETGKKIAREIVIDQVTTETLQDWFILAIELPRLLPFARSFLESSIICADLRRCLERRMGCDEKLMLRVLSIIDSNPNLIPILGHVSSQLSSVVQCKLNFQN